MARFHNAGGGCFAGHCTVAMADGSTKPVAEVTRGDAVALPQGAVGTVSAVLRTHSNDGSMPLCTLPGGLVATPYHPVRVNGAWVFPLDVVPAKELPCELVYTFALDVPAGGQHVLTINGVEAVGLAHGIKGDAVASHAFWGTSAVLDAMAALPGWHQGAVDIRAGSVVRDADTGLVTGFGL